MTSRSFALFRRHSGMAEVAQPDAYCDGKAKTAADSDAKET